MSSGKRRSAGTRTPNIMSHDGKMHFRRRAIARRGMSGEGAAGWDEGIMGLGEHPNIGWVFGEFCVERVEAFFVGVFNIPSADPHEAS